MEAVPEPSGAGLKELIGTRDQQLEGEDLIQSPDQAQLHPKAEDLAKEAELASPPQLSTSPPDQLDQKEKVPPDQLHQKEEEKVPQCISTGEEASSSLQAASSIESTSSGCSQGQKSKSSEEAGSRRPSAGNKSRPSPSFGSLETARESSQTKTTTKEGGGEEEEKQQNWHEKAKKQQQKVAPAGWEGSDKKTVPSSNWLDQMFGGGLCKCLFGGGTAPGDGAKDVESHQKKKKHGFRHGEKEKERIVRANDRLYNAQFAYADNFICTSKYTLLTFVPCNLYQQFTRIANFYFLVLLFLQCIPQIASVNWVYTFFPLSFVLLCSAIKEGYDDLQRHRNDKQVNTRISYVVRNSRLAEEEWMHVKVGDIIRMENEHFIAADLLLLSSSEPHGICYIETAELDGETNLKTRTALPETAPLDDILKDISDFDGKIVCEAPNNRLDHFEGRMEWRGKAIPLDNKNMLLRGCRLRNTRWCYGLVVFAGKDTKLMKNSGEAPIKRTSLDRFLNLLILGIVLFLMAICLICAVMCAFWEHIVGRQFRVFLPWDDVVPHFKNLTTVQLSALTQSEEAEESMTIAPSQVFFIAALQFFSYIIVLNTVVPISLYISVEMIRLAHSKLINNDLKMYDAKTDTPARARTSTLNEELGQVQYVFSDKTGTLTQNIMVFKKCSINGRSYGDVLTDRGELVDIDEELTPSLDFSWNRWHEPNFRFYDKTLMEDTKRGMKQVQEFWRLLAICHTVMPERKPGNGLEYQAQSPDEAALTSAARNFGYVFKSRTPQSVTLDVNGREEIYEMLHILDFDNVRKRMSVLVRAKSGKIKLYCKGADSMVLDRLSSRETSELLRSATHQHLDKFATDGLRTLCVACKSIEPDYCQQWMERLKQARLDTANKEKRVEALYEEMEQDLVLLGATAIEDKLQDGVPQTIATLAEANIKIWVLTGDKTETAINIGYSCRLLTENMREVFIIDGKEEAEVEVQLKDIKRRIQETKVPIKPMGIHNFYVPPRTPIRELSPVALVDLSQSPSSTLQRLAPKATPPAVIAEGQTIFPVEAEPIGILSDGTQFLAAIPVQPGQLENGLLAVPAGALEEELLPPGDGGYALVINGDSLAHALKRKYEKTFLDIGCNCVSVICCRVTPLQKAQVVDLVKRNVKAVTLSIGDGANDVSMIRTAHIGVGISGQEGMQAVLSSDFSIGQFRYLERLLLVHGRWSYLRMCKFLRYFFYKNFAYTLTHFWYSFFCGFSAQTVFDPFLISLYNLCFTALPVLFMAIFDQDVSDNYSIRFPRLYIPGQFNLFFNMRIFIYSIIHGMISSLVLFFIPFGALFHAVTSDGRDMNDYATLAFTTFTALVIVVNGQIAFDTAYWTWWNCFVVVGSLAFYFITVAILYQMIPLRWLNPYEAFSNVGIVSRAISSPSFWLSLVLICAILLLPVLGNRFFWFDTHPSYADQLRVRYRLVGEEKPARKASAGKLPRTAMSRRTQQRSLRSGYAFSHATGFGELIAKGTLFKNLEQIRIPSFHRAHHKHGGHQVHPVKENGTQIRRFSLLKGPVAFLPSLLSKNGSGNENVAASLSVTQFSPGSSNTTTTTTLGANNGTKVPMARPTMAPPALPAHLSGNGTMDSLVIEHSSPADDPMEELADHVVNEQDEAEQVQAERNWLRATAAVLVPLRVPSPDRTGTAHSLVINADLEEEKPLPSSWHYNPDGTLHIPELEQPPQPGTSAFQAAQQQQQFNSNKPKTFVSKKRREQTPAHAESMASNVSNSNHGIVPHRVAFVEKAANKPRREAPPPPKPQRAAAAAAQQRPETRHRVFTGKRKVPMPKTSSSSEEVEGENSSEGRERRRSRATPPRTSFGVEKPAEEEDKERSIRRKSCSNSSS